MIKIFTVVALASAVQDDGLMGPEALESLPFTSPTVTESYGPGPLQFGQLRLPASGGPFPVAIIIHGGCWTKGFEDVQGTAPIASALAEEGVATWNIEYRAVGDEGGGWPGMYQDFAAAADHLRDLATRYPLDLDHVVSVGHSAGAPAALWLAARAKLADGATTHAEAPLPVQAVVAVDGPADLRTMTGGVDEAICGMPVMQPLFGGGPDEKPAIWAEANPAQSLPLGVPQRLFASTVLSSEAAEAYRAAATTAGDADVTVVTLKNAGHFNMIAPGQPSWEQVEDSVVAAAKGD